VANVMEYYAGAANKLMGETIPVSKPGFDFTLREPIGVVGLIVPWTSRSCWPAGRWARSGGRQYLDPEARELHAG